MSYKRRHEIERVATKIQSVIQEASLLGPAEKCHWVISMRVDKRLKPFSSQISPAAIELLSKPIPLSIPFRISAC